MRRGQGLACSKKTYRYSVFIFDELQDLHLNSIDKCSNNLELCNGLPPSLSYRRCSWKMFNNSSKFLNHATQGETTCRVSNVCLDNVQIKKNEWPLYILNITLQATITTCFHLPEKKRWTSSTEQDQGRPRTRTTYPSPSAMICPSLQKRNTQFSNQYEHTVKIN